MELVYESGVDSAWIDYNGHMTESCYVLVFGYATDNVMAAVGLGEEDRKREQVSAYTVESHINYYREVHSDHRLKVRSYVVCADSKRMHVLHKMYRVLADGSEEKVAASEVLLVHVDTSDTPRSAPFRESVKLKLDELRKGHAGAWRPEEVCRSISVPS